VPVFNCVDKTFPLDGDHSNDLGGVAGLATFKGGYIRLNGLVGYTALMAHNQNRKTQAWIQPELGGFLGIPKMMIHSYE